MSLSLDGWARRAEELACEHRRATLPAPSPWCAPRACAAAPRSRPRTPTLATNPAKQPKCRQRRRRGRAAPTPQGAATRFGAAFPAACCAAAGGAAVPQGRHRRGWKSRAPETSQTRRAQPHRWRAAPREAQTALRHRPGSVYRAGERVRAPHALTLLCGPRRVQCSLAGRGWRPAACEGAAKPAGGDRTLAQRTAPRL